MKKAFILDTNVLIHDYMAINKFADNVVVIPIAVIEELDNFKTHSDERGKHARAVSRELDSYREAGKLNQGVTTPGGGLIKVDIDREQILPHYFKIKESDNRILNTAYYYEKEANIEAIVVSKDINLRLKAEALGIKSQDYEAGKVDIDELYSGIAELEVSSQTVDTFYQQKEIELKEGDFYPNQFVILRSKDNPKQSAMGRIHSENTKLLKGLMSPEPISWGIKPLNKEQRFAMELLLDDSVNLVTLVGNAGTGKTLISLAAGLQKAVDDDVYRRLTICRSIVPVGKDIGFLPGDKDEKLSVWMGAIYDNLEFLSDKKHPEDGMRQSQYLIETGRVEIASVTHIRGRTLPYQYMIVDDAQNLTPHEIKTILSRAGEGTKVVITGDPYQIDTPYLDSESNGLTYTVEKFKGQKIFGHITFTKTERSKLAALVGELMKDIN